MSKETTSKTITVALALCIVCSMVVSGAAVLLKDMQKANKLLDRQTNILAAAGLLDASKPVTEQFEQVKTRIVDLDKGVFTDQFDTATFDQLRLAKNPEQSVVLGENDQAKILRRENYAVVYVIEKAGELDKIILPIRGKGLWSTLHGFLALEDDLNTIAGLGFYDHAETPGLGGEVDNPKWKSMWPGKKAYQGDDVKIQLVKGSVNPQSSTIAYEVDGLAGATLTSRGVTNLVQFWLGEMGFQKFLTNLRAGEA
ncbi:Na(+)-translocating NADH-quinone reductase subunit C [Dasania sp. GY-MA-18]|uniref:Na(+)-translocating NADH-quinone reductase subunit C n=1 Tax=Dasania phycosphaerae TaxID=2950436 RepID=A0A9J6RJA9_9GAMM|nr:MULTISPECIES: Na(+)-translocating NADH-quinone reductase subunit C [Dasania]MCR8921908.1 Na(+)-translocating NADH-quinone reductase subunit C [Dasania sp. GY-MA-18]MCZ0864336.1 Na(+)-translocating NADH-quinone reductase subunit C [Dasania phycosphaerae]MCZ0868064.1 Na(+)-translocating NADH-quinone reductase subunit C [Dasania phycosphaerae]